MPLNIVREDIARVRADAVVNAANRQLQRGGGVCGAIFKAAGADRLAAACKPLAPVETGEVAVTAAFDLPARYIIHAVGPVYSRLHPAKSREELRRVYGNIFAKAVELGCESVAVPLISSGSFLFPKKEAFDIAMEAIRDFLDVNGDMEIILVLYDRESMSVGRELSLSVKSYIDDHYADRTLMSRRLESEAMPMASMAAPQAMPSVSFDDYIGKLDKAFSQVLLDLIDQKGMTDVEVYKRANIDRRLFSKIRNKDYAPGKRTVLALAVALRLDMGETEGLLKAAGFALSHNRLMDVIVEYFIISGRYDIFEINQVLFQYDQPLLGAGA